MPYRRSYAEARELLVDRARQRRNPMDHIPPGAAEAILARLTSLDPDEWATSFSDAAEPHWEAAGHAEQAGDADRARREYLAAYGFLRAARYPAPTTPVRKIAYRRSQEAFLKAATLMDPPVERVGIPYAGRQAPGAVIETYLRRPARDAPLPVVVQWGGIDSFKEERDAGPYLRAGLAVLAMDMPGVADAPIPGSEHGEELWNGIFDWIAGRPDLDTRRVVVVGASTGGYWATKLAHVCRDRIAAAVNHGGPAHFAFQADWIERAAHGEYPFGLAETLAHAFGGETAADWVDRAPALSLLDQGVLDTPSAPLLCVNGVEDSVFPIEDMYLLLRHGSAKTARFFPGGHMGHDPQLFPTIVTWICRELSRQVGPEEA